MYVWYDCIEVHVRVAAPQKALALTPRHHGPPAQALSEAREAAEQSEISLKLSMESQLEESDAQVRELRKTQRQLLETCAVLKDNAATEQQQLHESLDAVDRMHAEATRRMKDHLAYKEQVRVYIVASASASASAFDM